MLISTSKKTADDENDDGGLPIPTQFISNGEFWPFPQTREQQAVERLINEMADERARKLGVSRRKFLGSAAGMATALMAINIVSGCGDDDSGGFVVDDDCTRDDGAAREVFEKDFFVMDVQTHHADLDGPIGTNPDLLAFFRTFRICQPRVQTPGCTPQDVQQLSRANYIKEIFLDSDTAIAIMSGIPAPNAGLQLIGNAAMAATRDLGNRLGASQRMLTQGMVTPNFPAGNDARTNVSDMDWMKEELDIRAIKTYTGAGAGPNFPPGTLNPWGNIAPWWLDDEDVAYPMYEKARDLGINIVNTHKGLRLGIFDPDHIHPRDVPKAARDWQDMNFVIYHSAGEYLEQLCDLKTNEFPDLDNVYSELGAIFAGAVTNGVNAVANLLGRLLKAFGPDHVIWGTDSIWYGTPQWQINALKTFQMPAEFLEAPYNYPEITDEIRAKIFGLNAARLYKIDVDEVRCTVPADLLAQAKAAYPDVARPSLRQYGFKTRREFFKFAFTGKNPLA